MAYAQRSSNLQPANPTDTEQEKPQDLSEEDMRELQELLEQEQDLTKPNIPVQSLPLPSEISGPHRPAGR